MSEAVNKCIQRPNTVGDWLLGLGPKNQSCPPDRCMSTADTTNARERERERERERTQYLIVNGVAINYLVDCVSDSLID